jgi:hypothetical protein
MQQLCGDDFVPKETNQEAQQFSQGTNLKFNLANNVISLINFHNYSNQVHHNA